MIITNKKEQDYFEIITCQVKQIVEEQNISKEVFQANFKEIFTAAHNSYQEYLKGLLTNKEYMEKAVEKVYNSLRAV